MSELLVLNSIMYVWVMTCTSTTYIGTKAYRAPTSSNILDISYLDVGCCLLTQLFGGDKNNCLHTPIPGHAHTCRLVSKNLLNQRNGIPTVFTTEE